MNKFEILRYIKKWVWLIAVIACVGICLVYIYASNGQTYTATTYIKYTNKEATEGKTPNGNDINTDDIYSSTVIFDALKDLNLNTNVESIRKGCKVTRIIPDDEQKKQSYALDNGEEYSYFPTEYMVTFTCGHEYSNEYAEKVLDAIINNYFKFYCVNYINNSQIPNNAENVTTEKYDYIDCVRMLENTAWEITSYLEIKSSESTKFRSSKTGYSFTDFSDSYQFYLDYTIPKLYSYVLSNKLTNDVAVLKSTYTNQITKYKLKQENLGEEIDKTQALLKTYSSKSKEGIAFHYGNTSNSNYILDSVNNYGDGSSESANTREKTVYDNLITKYSDLKVSKDSIDADVDLCNDVLNTYSDVTTNTPKDSYKGKYITNKINLLAGEMNDLYDKLQLTVDDYTDFLSANNISSLTNISSKANINVKLYMLIAIFLFGFLGLFMAVLLGRFGDILEYIVYIDKHIGIYNRAKCDVEIERYEKKTLPAGFSCMVVLIDNLFTIDKQNGRRKTDDMLKEFAGIFSSVVDEYGFASYNGSGQFVALLNNCDSVRTNSIFDSIQVEYNGIKNEEDADNMFVLKCGVACSNDDNIYEIHKLFSCAIKKCKSISDK